MADVNVLLTSLWYTETTDAFGKPFTPSPDVYCISYPPMANSQDLKDRELKRRIFDHNSWADEQEGRPLVKETKQQVVVMTKPVEPELDDWLELSDHYYENIESRTEYCNRMGFDM